MKTNGVLSCFFFSASYCCIFFFFFFFFLCSSPQIISIMKIQQHLSAQKSQALPLQRPSCTLPWDLPGMATRPPQCPQYPLVLAVPFLFYFFSSAVPTINSPHCHTPPPWMGHNGQHLSMSPRLPRYGGGQETQASHQMHFPSFLTICKIQGQRRTGRGAGRQCP